jgi:hypothetical protein
LAKYVYTEAPGDALHFRGARTEDDLVFLQDLYEALGPGVRPNHIGGLYGTIIDVLHEVVAAPVDHPLPDIAMWVAELERIKGEGEDDHFGFFKALFMGRHAGFEPHPLIWSLSAHDPAYPSYPLPVNPTAYVGHEYQIEDPTALGLAWLGNLHYWMALVLIEGSYRQGSDMGAAMARDCMLGPLWAIGRHLPSLGVGMPFDPLSMGYAPGRDVTGSLTFALHLAREADRLARSLGPDLPADYPLEQDEMMIVDLRRQIAG